MNDHPPGPPKPATRGPTSAYNATEARSRDRQVLERIRSGERDGYEMYVQLYEKPLYNYLRSLRLDPEAAADLTQESFLKAYRSLDSFDPDKAAFRTWLYTIAQNLVRDRGRRLEVRARDAGHAHDEVSPAERCETRVDVERLLAELDPEGRSLLELRFMQDLPYDDVAAVTGLAASSVRSKVHRLLRRLQRGLGLAAPEGGED